MSPAGDWLAPDARPTGASVAEPRSTTGSEPVATTTATAVTLPVPLRPLTVTDILDGGIAALKAAPLAMFTVSAAFIVPAELLAAWIRRDHLSDSGVSGAVRVLTEDTEQVTTTGTSFLLIVLQSFVLALVATAVATLMASWYFKRPVTPRAVIAATVRRSPAVVALWLVVHLLEAFAALALVLPAVLVMAMCAPAIPVLAVEGCGPMRAISRSWDLVRTRFGAVLAAALLIGLVDLALTLALSGLGLLVESFDWAWIVDSILVGVSALVTVPFVAAATTLLYLDLRVRSEGLDIELGIAEHLRVR